MRNFALSTQKMRNFAFSLCGEFTTIGRAVRQGDKT